MSKSVILSLLSQGNTGNELLSILDAIASDQVGGFDYIESPVIEQVIGVPTLEEVAFWCDAYCVPRDWHRGAAVLCLVMIVIRQLIAADCL